MKDYTSDSPVFSSAIRIVETTDPAHADNINAATKQLLQNDLVLYALLNAVSTALISLTIPADGWAEVEDAADSYKYFIDVSDSSIYAEHIPFVTLEKGSIAVAAACGLCPTVETPEDGVLRFYAEEIPEADMSASCVLLKIGGEGSSGTGTGSYVLPVASAETLGGVMIGDGVNVDEDGTISVDANAVAESVVENAAADDEAVDELLDSIYGEEETE